MRDVGGGKVGGVRAAVHVDDGRLGDEVVDQVSSSVIAVITSEFRRGAIELRDHGDTQTHGNGSSTLMVSTFGVASR